MLQYYTILLQMRTQRKHYTMSTLYDWPPLFIKINAYVNVFTFHFENEEPYYCENKESFD